jgi:hypothetical protein
MYILNVYDHVGAADSFTVPVTNTFSDLYVYWIARATEVNTNNFLLARVNAHAEPGYCDAALDSTNAWGWTVGHLPCDTNGRWQASGNFLFHNYALAHTNSVYSFEGVSMKTGVPGCNKSGAFGGTFQAVDPVESLTFYCTTGQVQNFHCVIIGVNPIQ